MTFLPSQVNRNTNGGYEENMSDSVKAQMQALINDAKSHKAARDMASMDYRHAMKKLGMMAEAHPEIAKELKIVVEKKDGDKDGDKSES